MLITSMQFSIQTILYAMPIYKYGLLFLLTIIEGPLITMFAGWAAFAGYINPFIAYPIIVLADIVSDSIYYALGFWGRRKIVEKYIKGIGKSALKFQKIEALLHRHSGKAIIISKLTHVAGLPFIIAAGMAKINFSKFILFDFISTIPKSFALFILGYYFGQTAGIINQYMEYGTLIISGIIVIITVAYFYLGRYFDEKYANYYR